MKTLSAISLMTTMTLFAVALSRAPRSSSQVITITITNAGTWTRIGTPATCGADSSSPWSCGSALSNAVRYPVRSQIGRLMPTPPTSVLK